MSVTIVKQKHPDWVLADVRETDTMTQGRAIFQWDQFHTSATLVRKFSEPTEADLVFDLICPEFSRQDIENYVVQS